MKLKESELEILNKIIVGKLVIGKEFLSELRDVTSRDAERLKLLRKKIIKRKTHKKKSNIIIEKEFGIFFVSLMNEREAKEIEIWDDYLIYSVMFGQNKKIIEESEKYIEIIE